MSTEGAAGGTSGSMLGRDRGVRDKDSSFGIPALVLGGARGPSLRAEGLGKGEYGVDQDGRH